VFGEEVTGEVGAGPSPGERGAGQALFFDSVFVFVSDLDDEDELSLLEPESEVDELLSDVLSDLDLAPLPPEERLSVR
jgi:hypothetical protein